MSPLTSPNQGSGAHAVYNEIKRFFDSPVFFIVLGCLFLFAAYKLMDVSHPSFVFLLAILGVSIVLYGTGTHGVGSAEFTNVPIRVAVAGGAGLLAALFGFGVVWQADKIPEIFRIQHRYGLIRLINGDKVNYDFTKVFFSATAMSGTPLHLMTRSNLLQVIVPLTGFSDSVDVCVMAIDPSGKRLTLPDYCLSANLKQESSLGTESATTQSAKATDRQDFERVYEAILTLNPDALPKDDNTVFQAR